MVVAVCIAVSRLVIASSRPTGVLGRSSGHAVRSVSTAFVVASLNSTKAASCTASGWTVFEICSIGQLVSAGALALQTTVVGSWGVRPRRPYRVRLVLGAPWYA